MLVCGVTLELATEAPQAIQEREFIRELIAQGLTKDEIKDRLVAEFGPEVLAIPERRGVRPGGVAGAGRRDPVSPAVAIVVGLRRWRRAGAAADEGGSAEPGADEPVERRGLGAAGRGSGAVRALAERR